MQGSIFIALSDLVTEKFGLELWDRILTEVAPESGGAYTSVMRYNEKELFAIAQKLSDITEIALPDLIKVFGEYLFSSLYSSMPGDVDVDSGLKVFLLQVDSVIHKEVLRLHPEASLPSFTYTDEKPDELVMHYQSPRKLCFLSEGLLEGAAKQFGEPITITHDICMHKGDAQCDINIYFGER
ncbi:heme NO-binding domain-containing protein [Pleionea sp. CnH1-48]|uniref:heme NO-binding domain-containing protein n=1 Tax=Pleionea sp. CnH1-48 TaxID=2954494 RepID=UPI00209807DC|nr:heme NO-binding domain-containing protein [Pleionea sp. CnH1-48]MCO7223736.1 heme NO-binding domain-containing protein [Pleionea sp. CnH1-48]